MWRFFPNYRFSNTLYESSVEERVNGCRVWVDVGCGKGELIQELAREGLLSIGLDREIHPDGQAGRTFPLVRADAAFLPFTNNSIELITGNMMLEHLPDPVSALKETFRVLRLGGWMIQRTPNACHPLVLIVRFIPQKIKNRMLELAFGVPAHDVFPAFYRANRRGSLRRILREVGFNKPKIEVVEDVHTAFGIFFFLSVAYCLLVRIPVLSFMRAILLISAQKIVED